MVVKAFREEVDLLLNEGVPEDELAAAIKGYLDYQQNLRANDPNIAYQLQANLRWDRTMEFTAKIEAAIAELTPEMVQDALQKHLLTGANCHFPCWGFCKHTSGE